MGNADFLEFVLDQLAGLPAITHRRMFGGVGIYSDDVFFAIIDEGRLYFKVDDETRPAFEAQGMKAFAPTPDQIMRSYYEVPVDVLEDDAELRRWAQAAVAAQERARGAKRPRGPRSKMKPARPQRTSRASRPEKRRGK